MVQKLFKTGPPGVRFDDFPYTELNNIDIILAEVFRGAKPVSFTAPHAS
jgi:hypothetical protein